MDSFEEKHLQQYLDEIVSSEDAGDKLIVELLNKVNDVHINNRYGDTLLHLAARHGSPSIVNVLLSLGAHINTMNRYGVTPLHSAAEHGNQGVFELLLDKGADINVLNNKYYSPLHLAAENLNLYSVIKLLLRKGINLNTKNLCSVSLLHWVIENGDISSLELLLNNGAEANTTNERGESALYWATKSRKTSFVKLLLEKGAKVTVAHAEIPLHLAAIRGDTDIIELLLDAGSDINITNGIRNTPLHWAAQFGNQFTIQLLLNKGADVNRTNIDGDTALHFAVNEKNIATINLLIKHNAKVNATNEAGNTLLHVAAKNTDLLTLDLLLKEGAKVNVTNMDGNSPLHIAAQGGNKSMLELLLDNGANINFNNKDGRSPLHCAVLGGNIFNIELLLSKGAKINTKDCIGDTLIHFAAKRRETSILELLLNQGIDISITNYYGDSPLHIAVTNEIIPIIELLLNRGADVNMTNSDGYSPLYLAVQSAILPIVKLLLDNGSVVNAIIENGSTPLHAAALSGCLSIVELLLSKGANVNVTDKSGNTPLHFAVNSGMPFVVNALLHKGAAVNVTNKVGDSPLHLAATVASTRSVDMNSIDKDELNDAIRQKFIVNLLLDRGIDVNKTNNHGDMALHLAAKSGFKYFVELLLQEGAVVNTANKNGESPLYLAVHNDDMSIVDMLLNKHANVHTTDKYGNTPLHLAAFNNNTQIVKLLLRHGANVRHKNKAGETPGNVTKQYNSENSEEIINLLLTAEKSDISSVSPRKHCSLGFGIFSRIFRSNDRKEIQNNSLQNCIEPQLKYLKTDTSGMCGQLYETKLLSLVLLRALNDDHIEHFLLGSNIQAIGDMDDICLRFNERGRQTPILLFVQAKHRGDTEKGKLTMENMQSAFGDFSIRKYFESYLKIKERFREDTEDPMFRGDFKNVKCNFVIYTSAKDTIKKKTKQKLNNKVHYLINTGQNTNAFQYDFVENDVEILMKISAIARLKRLGAVFLDFIMSAKYKPETIWTDKLITRYHVVITKEVLQQKHIQQEMKDYRCWEFRPEFFKSKSEYLVILKTTFFTEILTKRCDQSKISNVDRDNFQLYVENQCETTLSKLIGKILTYNEKNEKMQFIENSAIAKLFKGNKLFPFTEILNSISINEDILNKAIELKLLSLEIKLPLSFGNLDMFFRGNASKVKKRMETVAEKLTCLLDSNKNTYVVHITDDIVGPGKTIEKGIIDINGGIGSAVGNLLILDTYTKMLKFDMDNNALPENALLFLNELQNQKVKLDNEVLSRYRIKVNIDGFPKGSFHGDEYDKEQVKDFLNKLWIYSEQAQQNEIERILKYEINKYYNDDNESNQIKLKIDSHDIFLEAHNEIQKWWMLKGEVSYLNRGDDFFKKAKLLCFNNLLLTINNVMHDLDICSVDVKFNTQVKLDNMSLKVDESFYRALSELGGILDTQNKTINIKNKDKKEIVNWLIKSYNDWKNNDRNTNHVIPNNNLINKTKYVFKKRTGTSAVRGYLYATKMLSLLLLRSLSDVNKDIFFLGNNIQDIGAMDDICLRYQAKGQQIPIVLFMQTKHREDIEKGKLTVEDVRSASGDFSLRKCFESYIKIKDHFLSVTEDPMFQGDFSNVECYYVIYTSARECFDKKKTKHIFNDNVHCLINTGQSSDVFQYEHNEEDINNLTNIIVKKEIKKMILVFLQLIMSAEVSSDLILTNNLIARYHVILAQEVLQQCTPYKNQDFRIWKFRREVFENNCEYMLVLKNTLFENLLTRRCDQSKITTEDLNNIKDFQNNPCKSTITKLIGKLATYNEKTGKLQLVEDPVLRDTSLERFTKIETNKNIIYEAIQDKLLSMEIKLPTSFGNLDMTFRGNEAEVQDRMKTVAKQLIKLLQINRNEEIIDINENVSVNNLEWDIIDCGVTRAIGNLLIFDTDTEMLKFNINTKALPPNAALFLNILIDHGYKHNEEKLNRIRIKVSNERFPKSSLKPTEFDKRHARDFISRLWFYANQAKEDEVERILKSEINKYYDNRTSHKCSKYGNLDNFIYLRSHDTIQNWSIQTSESHYIKRACKLFEDSKLADIYNLLLCVINYLYITSTSRVIWTFNQQRFKSVENIEKMHQIFRQMFMSLFKMFDLQPDLSIDIKHPHSSWFSYEHLESSFSIEIHPEMESAVLKMVTFSRSGASDFAVIAKAGPGRGRILMLTTDSLKEILVPSTPLY